jgi:hypothetical protein
MKSNELRIGNLVQDQNGNLLKVIGLTTESKSLYVVDRSKFPLPQGWKDEPIPLTEDWLLKFGFEGVDYVCPENGFITKNESFELEIDTYSRIIIESDFSFGIESLDRKSDVIFKNDILDSVHRLQNLYFALTGQELEITTPQK